MAKKLTYSTGGIEVICGPMFAGKTEELIRRLNRFKFANIDFVTFKPEIDTRDTEKIRSRNGTEANVVTISKVKEILEFLNKNQKIKVIAIDEAQFFNADLIPIVTFLAQHQYHIIISGLDKDFRAKSFETISALMAIADEVEKLHSICAVCGNFAVFSQRLVNKKPAAFSSPTILIGDTEHYEPRCREHFILGDVEQDKEFENFKNLLYSK